mgnify:CR=1 FL=1
MSHLYSRALGEGALSAHLREHKYTDYLIAGKTFYCPFMKSIFSLG